MSTASIHETVYLYLSTFWLLLATHFFIELNYLPLFSNKGSRAAFTEAYIHTRFFY